MTDVVAVKRSLRRGFSTARSELPAADLDAARQAVRAVVLARFDDDAVTGKRWRNVFAYEPMPREPGSPELLQALSSRGCTVYVPVLLADRDLDWKQWKTPQALGVDAMSRADVVIVPALAVDRRGVRLGRGGGSYDRALAQAPAEALVVALLHRRELIAQLPAQPWDVPVAAVAAPDGWTDFAQAHGRSRD